MEPELHPQPGILQIPPPRWKPPGTVLPTRHRALQRWPQPPGRGLEHACPDDDPNVIPFRPGRPDPPQTRPRRTDQRIRACRITALVNPGGRVLTTAGADATRKRPALDGPHSGPARWASQAGITRIRWRRSLSDLTSFPASHPIPSRDLVWSTFRDRRSASGSLARPANPLLTLLPIPATTRAERP
jgi:hypothetical protein